MPKKPKLTMKEILVFSLAYCNKLDKNGELKDTKMNKVRYRMSCRIAGGEKELEKMIGDIMEKFRKQGFDVDAYK